MSNSHNRLIANNSSSNTILSRNYSLKIGQSGWFLGRRLGPLLKTDLPLKMQLKMKWKMKNTIKPLAKTVLIPLGLTAPACIR